MAPSPNGVLSVSTTALQKSSSQPSTNGTPRAASNRSHQNLKFIVRRLAPGLTQHEFELALGDDWRPGQGYVDWIAYNAGKISKDLAKPSRPSRAYIHLSNPIHVEALLNKLRGTAFSDSRNSTGDPALVGPPIVELAPFFRIPGSRRCTDNCQGLIDQDPAFKEFLEGLTNPITKPSPALATVDNSPTKNADVNVTPLIEYLRERKAAKEKTQQAKYQGKQVRGESKDEKADAKSEQKGRKGGGREDKTSRQRKAEKTTKKSALKEIKIINKESTIKKVDNDQTGETKAVTPVRATAERRRERGSTRIVKEMLQRDLGIIPASGVGRSRRDVAHEQRKVDEMTPPMEQATTLPSPRSPAAASVPMSTGTEPRFGKKDLCPGRTEHRVQKAAKVKADAHSPDKPKLVAAHTPPATGPRMLRKHQSSQQTSLQATFAARTPLGDSAAANAHPPTNPTTQPGSRANSSSRKTDSVAAAGTAAPPATARQAFLKHANPSQGVTEPLIEAALSVFGAIDTVAIDKRKGFAYVDFKEPSGLQKAIQASPIKVGEGAVQVLERRDKATLTQRTPKIPPVGPVSGTAMRPGRTGFKGSRGGRGRGVGRGGVSAVAPVSNASAPAAAPTASAVTSQSPGVDMPS